MASDAPVASIWSEPRWRVAIWIVLCGAFSPVLVQLAQHLASHPWARTALVFPWLAWVAIRMNPETQRSPNAGLIWGCLIFALALELIAVSGDAPRIARVGVVVGVLGLVWGAGWAKGVPALVLLWVIPLPTMLLEILSPRLEGLLGSSCAAIVPGVGMGTVGVSPAFMLGSGEALVLGPAAGGLALIFALFGLGWFRGAARAAGPRDAFAEALRWALCGLPLQGVILLGAAAMLASGARVEAARSVLDHSGWILVTVVGLGISLSLLRSPMRSPEEALPC